MNKAVAEGIEDEDPRLLRKIIGRNRRSGHQEAMHALAADPAHPR